MFKKILVCNRGEIALRILRTCREMGIKTVQIYSTADADSRAAQLADETVQVGPSAASRSYLHIPSIIHACLMTNADAVHPGYGFLSEDPDFAEICADHGIAFIGPPPHVMARMADKSSARRLMAHAGLAVLGGSDVPLQGHDDARTRAHQIGYPVILKAAAGGGGRGMRVVWAPAELRRALEEVRHTARAIFRDDRVYLEKFVQDARHVEIQVFGDRYGNLSYLGERDCSIQRRQQKLLEESPSTFIDHALRARMGAAALAGTRAIGYQSAGTVEFLVDRDRNFWFLEMNTRIQVEHPVTEMATGHDLIELMIRAADGEKLASIGVDAGAPPTGHTIECRVNAEDPANNWTPSSGTLTTFVPHGGPGVRVDTHAYVGYTVPPFYDSLLAKVVVHGRDREHALHRMQRALGEFTIEGVTTTIPFHLQLLQHPVFRSGSYFLNFLEQYMQADGSLARAPTGSGLRQSAA